MKTRATQKITELWLRVIHCLQHPFSQKVRLPGFLRILLLAIRGFNQVNCPLHASALTFYSILSVVPVLAMAFGIAKGFGFQNLLEKYLIEEFQSQQEVLTWMISLANSMLENTRGGMVAGIGVFLLFWSVVKVLGHIEHSFNAIWYIEETRSFWRKFSDYLTVMLLSPVLIILSSSVTVFIRAQVTTITEKVALIGYFNPIILFGLNLLPFSLIWVLFSLLYILMPNTRVKFSSGVLAGVLAGTLYHLAQWTYIGFQVGVARYNAVYGTFTALPLFLIWLQLSWLIVLFGAEIAFALQNVEEYALDQECDRISPYRLRLLTLEAACLMVKNFAAGAPSLTRIDLARQLSLPVRLVNRIVQDLLESGTFSQTVMEKKKVPAFQPARDIQLFTLAYLIEALDQRGSPMLCPRAVAQEENAIDRSLQTFQRAIEASPANILLKDL